VIKVDFPALKFEEWPVADLASWLDARKPGKLFKKSSPASGWKPDTLRNTERAYRVYLGWLNQCGILDVDAKVIERVTETRIDAFLEEYTPGRAPNSVAGAIRGIAFFVKACHPPVGLDWLNKLAWSLTNSATNVIPKLPRLVTVPDLITLGVQLMKESKQRLERPGSQKVRIAETFRNGLMIAALANRPLRISELLSLKLEQTLFREDAWWRVELEANLTKNGRLRCFNYPANLTDYFDYYVAEIRGLLLRDPSSLNEAWMWVRKKGPLSKDRAGVVIGNLTEEYLGKRVTPHLFRDCVATSIALNMPEKVFITKSLLGHASPHTGQKFYNQAIAYDASRELDAAIASLIDEEE
jgi:integrase/recombinase XerD